MKVRLEVGPDSDVKVETDDAGNVLAIEFTPSFGRRNSVTVLAYCIARTEKGKTLERFSLAVSGATGKVSKTIRSASVQPTVEDGE